MVQSGITSALSVLIECLPPLSGDETEEYGSVVDIPDVIKRTKATSRRLLDIFVSQQSDRFCKLIRTSLEAPNWRDMKEPREVREVMGHVMRELDVMSRTISVRLGTLLCSSSYHSIPSLEHSQVRQDSHRMSCLVVR